MNCAKIRELIITDYMDGEAVPDVRSAVERHLTDCRQCREYAVTVRATAHDPFTGIYRQQVPADVWEKVRRRIVAPDLFRMVIPVIPRPAMAGALMLVLFISASVLFQARRIENVQAVTLNLYAAMEELVFPARIDNETLPSGFDTVFEQFFL